MRFLPNVLGIVIAVLVLGTGLHGLWTATTAQAAHTAFHRPDSLFNTDNTLDGAVCARSPS